MLVWFVVLALSMTVAAASSHAVTNPTPDPKR
jgi:hypothetical protein